MKLPTRYFVFFAWIPTSLALAYGSISFMLLDPNIPEWSFCARFSMLLGWAWLLYIPVRVTEELACFFVLLLLSGVISYAVFSFLLFNAAPAEWSRPVRYLSVCLTSWLAFSLTPFRDVSTTSLDRLGRSTMSFGCHMAFFFLVAPGMGD